MNRVFIPYYEEKIRFAGEWYTRRKLLFPGYLFLEAEDPYAMYFSLKKVPKLTKLLGDSEDLHGLTNEESAFIRKMLGEDDVMEMSEGIIINDRVIITEGPLQGLESEIVKIDRHKRKAWIEREMFGRIQRIEVGLEIVKKIRE